MGASGSHEDLTVKEAQEMVDLDGSYQDMRYPWFHIIQWSSEKIPAHKIWKWDYDSIRMEVEQLSADAPTFVAYCRRNDEEGKIENFSLDDETIFLEWAAALLCQIKSLGVVRYKLVPARMSEEQFWERYFATIRSIIQSHIKKLTSEEGAEGGRGEGTSGGSEYAGTYWASRAGGDEGGRVCNGVDDESHRQYHQHHQPHQYHQHHQHHQYHQHRQRMHQHHKNLVNESLEQVSRDHPSRTSSSTGPNPTSFGRSSLHDDDDDDDGNDVNDVSDVNDGGNGDLCVALHGHGVRNGGGESHYRDHLPPSSSSPSESSSSLSSSSSCFFVSHDSASKDVEDGANQKSESRHADFDDFECGTSSIPFAPPFPSSILMPPPPSEAAFSPSVSSSSASVSSPSTSVPSSASVQSSTMKPPTDKLAVSSSSRISSKSSGSLATSVIGSDARNVFARAHDNEYHHYRHENAITPSPRQSVIDDANTVIANTIVVRSNNAADKNNSDNNSNDNNDNGDSDHDFSASSQDFSSSLERNDARKHHRSSSSHACKEYNDIGDLKHGNNPHTLHDSSLPHNPHNTHHRSPYNPPHTYRHSPYNSHNTHHHSPYNPHHDNPHNRRDNGHSPYFFDDDYDGASFGGVFNHNLPPLTGSHPLG